LAQGAEAIAAELRMRARLEEADSMRVLAARLNVPVHEHPLRCMNGKAARQARAIILSPSGYEPRDEFTIAHELAELHLPAQWRSTLSEQTKERCCNRIAAALLLPAKAFLWALHETDWDLPAVRRRFPRVSFEAVATRIVDLRPGTTAASWVNGKRAWWRGPQSGADVRDLVRAEHAALRIAARAGSAAVQQGSILARAWSLTAKGKTVSVSVCRGLTYTPTQA
jgi:Zn-dependent peptidase ImmA (M78 family)